VRQAALEVYFARNAVDTSQKERDAAALLAAQRAAAVETLQAQYQELMSAVARANTRALQLTQARPRVGRRAGQPFRVAGGQGVGVGRGRARRQRRARLRASRRRGSRARRSPGAAFPRGPALSRPPCPPAPGLLSPLPPPPPAPSPQPPQDVSSAKSSLSLAGMALSLQRGAAHVLQGQLNNSMVEETMAAIEAGKAESKLRAAAEKLADAVATALDKNGTLTQITELGEKLRAAGDPQKQLPLIQAAIAEAAVDAQRAGWRVGNLTKAKVEAEVEWRKQQVTASLMGAKSGGFRAIYGIAANETAKLQARGRPLGGRARGAARRPGLGGFGGQGGVGGLGRVAEGAGVRATHA
jgi:hypothetical protein